MGKTLVSVLLLGLAFVTPGKSQQAPDQEKALETFASAVEGVRSFDVTVTATMKILIGTVKDGDRYKARKLQPGEQPRVRTEYSRQVYDQGKGRIEILDRAGGKATMVIAYDHQVGKAHLVKEKAAAIDRSIRSTELDGGDYRDTYRTIFGGIPFGDLVRCFRERKGYVAITSPTATNPLLTLQANPVAPNDPRDVTYGPTAFRVALDPRRGMMPAVIEVLRQLDGELVVYRRMTVTDWKDVGNGLWVPIKATIQVLNSGKVRAEAGDIATETTLIVDVARSSWNKGLNEEAVQLPLPTGTKVTDRERSVRYVTGQPDPGKNLDELAKHVSDVVPITTVTPRPKTGWSGWIFYGSGIAAAVVLLGIVGVAVRKRLAR